MSDVVLDASALLAILNDEPGADEVSPFIPGATINTVNFSEVIAKLAENGMPENEIREALGVLGLKILPFDENLSYKTGLLRPTTKNKGLSLGDRACLASGLEMNFPVITADRKWQQLELPLEIRLIR